MVKTLTILDLKSKFLLVILGSYNKKALVELNKLRDCLVSKGYKKCRLVSDYTFPKKKRKETDDQYFHRKSVYWLENSDACIFVFLNSVNNDGVAFELHHTCDHLETKLETSLVAIDSRSTRYTTSLLRGKLANLIAEQKINQRYFHDSKQLCAFSSSASISFLKKRRYYILERLS